MRISDWSSDVCSSDLLRLGRFAEGWAGYHYRRKPVVEVRNPDGAPLPEWSGAPLAGQRLLLWRSEERRVGKEGVSTCRSRWSPYHEKKNKLRYMTHV